MGKIRRGGYELITWKGDHDPKHVHVLKDGKEICKWNLEEEVLMKGRASKRVRKIIEDLVKRKKL